MNSITLSYSSQRQLERKVKAILLQWGYGIIPPSPVWTKMADFRAELNLPASTLSKILDDPECPDFPGKSARRRQKLVVTPALRLFLKKRKKPSDLSKPASYPLT